MQLLHGSGKTAVLVERIINKVINEKIDIDKLLVVTFTNAAASEMRERMTDAIYKKLEENPEDKNLQRQITLLSKSNICTIDSFCLDVIKNNFFEIDISPNFRIADTAEIELLKQEVLEELFEEKYENQNEDFIKLINTYTSYREDTDLKELVLKIYTYTRSSPFPEKWLDEQIEKFNLKDKINQDFANTTWGKLLLEEIEEELIDDITILTNAKVMLGKYPEAEKFERTILNDIESIQRLKDNLDKWDTAYEIAQNLSFAKWPVDKKVTVAAKEEAKKIRDNVKKKLKKKIDKILIFNSQEANEDINDMYDILSKLKDLIEEFGKEFSKKKKEKNILDFSDIEHLALKILLKEDENGNIIKTEVAKKYQDKFEEIAIDEYQDSNLVQEYILTAIQKNRNFFMVGDVKQSIYKFRQAKPELFLAKYSKYKLKEQKNETDDLKIQLFKNFRSRENILEFTNLIFENIMSSLVGDIEYNKDEFLNLGADYEKTEQDYKTEIDIIDLKEETDEEEEETNEIIGQAQVEAKFVAKRIKELIDSKMKVYDLKTKTFRCITYKDIVVLLRSTKELAPIYEKEIIDLNMPVFSDSSSEYLDSIEIQTIMSVLKVIDNPLNDIPLVTVLRSQIGGFTDNDLVQIRLADKYSNFYTALLKARTGGSQDLRMKIDAFLSHMEEWRKKQEYLPLDSLIWQIYTDTGYYNYVGLMPNGDLRQANLKMLFERAKQYENASFRGLYNFINFIEKLSLSSGDLSAAKLIGENEDVIRIMSIHKSKGLEFPVVVLASTGKQFNLMDLNSTVLLHQDMGIGVKYIDYERQIEYDTLSKAAIRNKLYTESLSEEMRILYVALTRAKEKLIITATAKDFKKDLKDITDLSDIYIKDGNKINPVLMKRYKKYIDWILLVSQYEKVAFEKLAKIDIFSKEDILKENSESLDESVDTIKVLSSAKVSKEDINKIKKLLEFEYKHKDLEGMLTKMSVTQIKQIQERENIYDVFSESEIQEEDTENESKPQNNITFRVPKFLADDKEQKITAAQKGTLIHMCFQRLDIKKEYSFEDIHKLISMLQAKEIITEVEANSIDANKIYKFTKSKLWDDLKQAKEVYREKPFYINIPASQIYEKDIDEEVLVQGIIDLYYIDKDGNLILVDYKTDYVPYAGEQELIAKYEKQLNLYQQALEEALDKKVYKKYIYSVYLDKLIELN